ncbi:MAG: hypothetical protein D8M59_14265 [Planctomycetes bacterium]|nr:hypothetical protein [Planctomycetota bacterium]NOG55496.1 DEAD/DEAH box helicase family protein [Planctomycetota bacterium]
MNLKEYQKRVIQEVETYLDRVAALRVEGETRFASMAAWQDLRISGTYTPHTNGIGQDMPNFTIKVPTGGGKTLIATQVLGSIHRTILRDRNGAGLVLWVVPSSQIYRDTLKRLGDRRDLYRIMLEHAVSRRIELWEKSDIHRLTPAKLRDSLNILVIQLASTNRETKEQLKFFRDSGGNIMQHFPPEDDVAAHEQLKQSTPNLGIVTKQGVKTEPPDGERGPWLVATSIGNLVAMCKPAVILDEGHKATSQLARDTIAGFNASVVVELSATPHKGANIISRVSGQELLDEEMIKLPLNIATSGQKSWKDALTQARDKQRALKERADQHAITTDHREMIRPIVLVQVERTGKEQRGNKVRGARVIHSEDVREYLTQRLDVPERAIAVKTSETDDIEGIELLDPECPVEWIITKSALQEGWDCPFAYILCSLNNTGSGQSMTQLIGRILRQPYQKRVPIEELNESYIYCLHRKAGTIAREVKQALEKEGYEGDLEGVITEPGERQQKRTKVARIRDSFSSLYNREFDGKIYLPRFCVVSGHTAEPLDYYRHLLARIDVDAFEYASIDWPLAEELMKAKDRFYRISLGEDLSRQYETEIDLYEPDTQVRAWLAASLPFDYLSFKQLARIVSGVCDHLLQSELRLKDQLALVKFVVRDHIEAFVRQQLDEQTKKAFVDLYDAGRVQFYLKCTECRFEIPPEIEVRATRRLRNDEDEEFKKSLFDYVDESEFNEYEKVVAICFDDDANILWWYRNLVGADNFAIQGYRREKIYPDFVVKDDANGRELHRVIVVETKGDHLAGSLDTEYKTSIAKYFERVGKRVTWQQLGEEFKDHQFRFQVIQETGDHGRDWRDELRGLLAAKD